MDTAVVRQINPSTPLAAPDFGSRLLAMPLKAKVSLAVGSAALGGI